MASSTSAFTRRSFLGLGVGAAAVTALAACSSGGSGSTSTSGTKKAPGDATSGTINFWGSAQTVNGVDFNKVLIGMFEEKYPNIKVKYIIAPTQTDTDRATLTTQISGGGGPDVFMGDVIWPAQFGDHQLCLPLSDYLPQSYFNSFANGLIAGASYKGKVYAAPYFEDQGFLYYRKDLLQKYNLEVPQYWEDLVDTAKKVQAGGDVEYGYVFQGADYEGATCNFMEFLTDAGGAVLNTAGTKSVLNSDAAVKALTFEQSLVTSGVAPKATSTYQEQQSMNDFANGKSLFLRNWDYAYDVANATGAAAAGKIGVTTMPTFKGMPTPGYSNIGGWNFYINPHSKNVAADLTFIKFMTGTAAQTAMSTKFGYIPTNAAVRKDPKVIAAAPPLAAASKTKLVARPCNTPNYPAVSQAIYDAVNGVLAGSLEPKAAIAQASANVTKAISATSGL